MAELRRLLIEPDRLKTNVEKDMHLVLQPHESHYLKRVLRLRRGDAIALVDGIGHLWEATLQDGGALKFSSSFEYPIQERLRPKPLIGLAVVLPKRGFDELLRMSCEIGVDIIQPLSSKRGVIRMEGDSRSLRREGIIREAVEQSERLWAPKLLRIVDFEDWLRHRSKNAVYAIAVSRLANPIDLQVWMLGLKQEVDQIWIAVGPEGGWTKEERFLAKEAGCMEVQFGDSIMRTSTAAVAAIQLMVTWRRNSFPSVH